MAKRSKPSLDESIDQIEEQATAEVNTKPDTVEDSDFVPLETRMDQLGSRRKKVAFSMVLLAILLGAVFTVPFLRYGLLGVFVKKTAVITVVDAGNKKPVMGAKVSLGRADGTTDANGKAILKDISVGDHEITIEKTNYKPVKDTYRLPLIKIDEHSTWSINATGRTVTVNVKDKISGESVQGASVDFGGNVKAVTDDKGVASVVLAPNANPQKASVKKDGYNETSVDATVSAKDDVNLEVQLIPSGRLAFLSKRTGVINIMSANLDGGDQKVLIEGTGRERDSETLLVPAPDWQTAILLTQREPAKRGVYAVNVKSGELHDIAVENAYFQSVGWIGDNFYYTVYHSDRDYFGPKTNALMAYNAQTGKNTVIDETIALDGSSSFAYATEKMTGAVIVDDTVAYAKYWVHANRQDHDFSVQIMSVKDVFKRTLKSVPDPATGSVDIKSDKPTRAILLAGMNMGEGSTRYEITTEKVTKLSAADDDFYANRKSFLLSPDGDRAFWSEQRDGKNVTFVANKDLTNGQQLSTGEYVPYGWFTNTYVLYSQKNSELFIGLAGKPLTGEVKVTDYHKANLAYPSYQ